MAWNKKTRWVLGICAALVVALLIFHAGAAMGSRHAFSRHGFFLGGHGAVGTIAALNLPTLVLSRRDGVQERVLLENETIIRTDSHDANTTDLAPGESVIVVGEPEDQDDSGARVLDARLIRILSSSSTTNQTPR